MVLTPSALGGSFPVIQVAQCDRPARSGPGGLHDATGFPKLVAKCPPVVQNATNHAGDRGDGASPSSPPAFRHRPPPTSVLGLAQGEGIALTHLGGFAAALGLDPPAIAAYEPRAGCQAYPAHVAWLA